MYLLDTNVCIDFARARSDDLRERIRRAFGSGLSISAITLAELRVGARDSAAGQTDERLLDQFVSVLTVHDFDSAAADRYGLVVRRKLMKRHSFDRLIAAHALSLDLTLVTNNVGDFADVPGLRVENWTQ